MTKNIGSGGKTAPVEENGVRGEAEIPEGMSSDAFADADGCLPAVTPVGCCDSGGEDSDAVSR